MSRPFFRTVKTLHAQIFVCAFTSFLILKIPQIHNLILIFAEEKQFVQTFLALIGITVLAFSLWATGRWLTVQNLNSEESPGIWERKKLTQPEIWLPRLLGALPLVTLTLSIITLAIEDDINDGTKVRLLIYAVLVTITLLTFLYLTYTRKNNRDDRTTASDRFMVEGRGKLDAPIWAIYLAAGSSLIVCLTFVKDAFFAEFLGTLFLAFTFLSTLTWILTIIGWKSKKHRFSYWWVLIILSIGIASTDVADNHRLALRGEPIQGDSTMIAAGRDARADFEKWLKHLEEKSKVRTESGKTPVYLVAAQGGGIYAAYHAAMTLAMLDDSCLGFSEHLYAISSVSGGSLGSALYIDLLYNIKSQNTKNIHPPLDPGITIGTAPGEKTNQGHEKGAPIAELCNTTFPTTNNSTLHNYIWQAFIEDWLSPIVARTLFAEPFLTFIPLPCSYSHKLNFLSSLCSRFDQAKALEASLSRSGNHMTGGNSILSKYSVSRLYQANPENSKSLPRLIINTADVTSGTRVTISSIDISGPGTKPLHRYLPNNKAPTVAEAAVLSARFPFFTQAGYWTGDETTEILCDKNEDERCNKKNRKWYQFLNPLKVRFVDAGYNDNSGLQSLDDLIFLLRNGDSTEDLDLLENVELNVIALTQGRTQSISGNSFNELGTPVKSMLKMWGAKAHELASKFERTLSVRSSKPDRSMSGNFYRVCLDRSEKQNVPLGWKLSLSSRAEILTQIKHHSFVPSSKHSECPN